MSGSTTLSVIVPVYNEQYLVHESLRRLQVLGESPLLSRVKVIVVDDHSTDQTPRRCNGFRSPVREILHGVSLKWLFLRHDRNQEKAPVYARV